MAKTREELLALLNCPEGLENLKALMKTEPAPATGRDVNNHIHTTYSFSPYSPTRRCGSPGRRGCAPAA